MTAGPPGPPVEPNPPVRRPVSHRAPSTRDEAFRRLIPPLAAVSSVVLVIVLLLVLNGPAGTSGPGPALRSPASVAQTTPAEPSPTAPTATPSRSPRSRPPVKPPPATASPVLAKAPVTVLNNSRVYHLAARAAAQLSSGGWPISTVGNFTGRIPVSTVYYAPGQEQVAQALARQFPAVARVHPRFRGLPGSGLTLVVTREWPA